MTNVKETLKAKLNQATTVKATYSADAPINIYIANLHDYNCGRLVGEWVSLPMVEEDLEAVANEISRGYELAIHDYECDFMRISEYDDIFRLNEIAEQYENLFYHERIVVTAHMDYYGSSIEEALEVLDSGDYAIYHDCTDTADVALELLGEGMISADTLETYFDFEAFARDLEIEGYNPYDFCGCYNEDCEDCQEAVRQEEEGIDYLEVAEELFDSGCVGEEQKALYFDHEAYGRDLDIEGVLVYSEGCMVEFY